VQEALIGAGGWGYFAGGLEAYARAFGFAETNVTFYRQISEAQARRWRARAPSEFVFAVKAHRSITHGAGLMPTAAARDALAHDARIARILRAPFLILETPPNLPLDPCRSEGLRDLVASTRLSARVGLEARAHRKGPLPEALARTMEDIRILDVVDLSVASPRIASDEVYTRVFGKGEGNRYELDDSELRALGDASRDAVRVAFTFHGVHMYRDAARFLTFRRTGTFPPVTSKQGLDSLAEALAPDAHFPTTRDALLRDHGWKVFDTDTGTRAHAADVLARLPRQTYASLAAIVDDIRDAGLLA